jgi:hypothetical protein
MGSDPAIQGISTYSFMIPGITPFSEMTISNPKSMDEIKYCMIEQEIYSLQIQLDLHQQNLLKLQEQRAGFIDHPICPPRCNRSGKIPPENDSRNSKKSYQLLRFVEW